MGWEISSLRLKRNPDILALADFSGVNSPNYSQCEATSDLMTSSQNF